MPSLRSKSKILKNLANSSDELEFSLFGAIINSTDEAILSYDLSNHITSWNPAAERLYGHRSNQAIGQSITLIVPPDRQDEWDQIHEVILLDQSIEHFETMRLHRKGHLINVSITYSPIKDSTGNIFGTVAITRDITEQKKLENRKDEFIIMTSHELKTPITSMKIYTQLMQQQFHDRQQTESLSQISKVNSQLDRLAKIVSDLLDISRIQSGKLELHKEDFYLDEVLQDTIENLQNITQHHKIIVTKLVHQQLYGDKDRLNQVIINLLINAIKYSPRANKVEVCLDCDDHSIEISVQDYGIGIPNEHQHQIFERFFRVSGSSDTFPGLGIGLYLSSEIVQRHGGQINVNSQPNVGSRFTVKLPLK